MNETQEKITPIKNSQAQDELKAKYEAEIEKHKQKSLDWENACYKRDDTILELQKAKEWAEQERDGWKKEAHRNRRIEQEKKSTKEQNDFLTEFTKLQQAKTQGGRI